MRFEKVSFEAFEKDFNKYFGDKFNGLHLEAEEIENEIKWFYDRIKLPKRSTKGSCGYDIYSPMDFIVHANEVKFIPTGIKVYLDDDKFLMVAPRSSSAKKRYQLGNRVAFIDADYVDNEDNEGDIIISLEYCGKDTGIRFSGYDAIAQGIILPFFKVEDDDADGTRLGGYGSTDKPKEEVKENTKDKEMTIDEFFNEVSSIEEKKDEVKEEEPVKEEEKRPDTYYNRIRINNGQTNYILANSNLMVSDNPINALVLYYIKYGINCIRDVNGGLWLDMNFKFNHCKTIEDISAMYTDIKSIFDNISSSSIPVEPELKDKVNLVNIIIAILLSIAQKYTEEKYKKSLERLIDDSVYIIENKEFNDGIGLYDKLSDLFFHSKDIDDTIELIEEGIVEKE